MDQKNAAVYSGALSKNTVGALIDVTGGTVGGLLMTLVGHPLDTVKVRLQTQSSTNPIYTGLSDCVKKTIQNEGVSGLYKGISAPIIGQMVFNAAQFMLYGQISKVVATTGGFDNPSNMNLARVFLTGSLTGAGVALVEAPQDLLKSQLQVQVFRKQPLFTTLPGCVKYLTGNFGMTALYQGLGATVVRNSLCVALYFGVYEGVRRQIAAHQNIEVKDLSTSSILIAGGAGGAAYWGIGYPLDMVKSSMQGDSPNKSERLYKSLPETFRKLYANGGFKQFYRGFSPCFIRAIPGNAICFLGYQYTKDTLSLSLGV